MISAAAIFAKNQTLKHWSSSDLPESDRILIRGLIFESIFGTPATVPESLFSVAQYVSMQDFPSKWPTFLVDLKSKTDIHNPTSILRCYKILDTSFEYIRKLPKNNDSVRLVMEICNTFADHFVALIEMASGDLSASSNATVRLETLMHAFSFYRSIITFDIPQFFVDHSMRVFGTIVFILKCWNEGLPVMRSNAKLSDALLSNVFMTLNYYAGSFDEDLNSLPEITQQALSFAIANGGPKLEAMSLILRFLGLIVKKEAVGDGFKNSASLLLERVIVPNMTTSRAEVDLMKEEPLDFCRNDINALTDEDSMMSSVNFFMKSLIVGFPQKFSKAASELILLLIKSGTERELEQAVRLFTASVFSEINEQVNIQLANFRPENSG